jgi:multiple sugar transport system permease protein
MGATSITTNQTNLLRNRALLWLFFGGLALLAALWIIPIVWMLSMSLTPNDVLQIRTSGLIPSSWTLENYTRLLSVSAVPRWFLNSAIVSGGTTLGTLILSSLAGYALARIPFKGRNVMFVFILAGLMVPEQAVFIPLHTMFSEWDLHNTHIALMLPRLSVPLGVFIMTQFFRAIPRDIEEAARLDGANRLQIYLRVMLPLTRPALTTLGIFTFVLSWNDFLWPLVSATQQEMFTVTIGLASLQGNFAQSEGLGSLMTSAVVASLPMLILFLLFQRYIVEAVQSGSRF